MDEKWNLKKDRMKEIKNNERRNRKLIFHWDWENSCMMVNYEGKQALTMAWDRKWRWKWKSSQRRRDKTKLYETKYEWMKYELGRKIKWKKYNKEWGSKK